MRIIPVLTDFDHAKPIGAMVVDETLLPLGAGYHFALGYTAKSFDERGRAVGVELVSVAAVPDEKFLPELPGVWYEKQLLARDALQKWRKSLPQGWYGNAYLDDAIAAFDAILPPGGRVDA